MSRTVILIFGPGCAMIQWCMTDRLVLRAGTWWELSTRICMSEHLIIYPISVMSLFIDLINWKYMYFSWIKIYFGVFLNYILFDNCSANWFISVANLYVNEIFIINSIMYIYACYIHCHTVYWIHIPVDNAVFYCW